LITTGTTNWSRKTSKKPSKRANGKQKQEDMKIPWQFVRFTLETPKNRLIGDFLPYKLRSNRRFAGAR
jgi:hypothetical protein